ncbi:MAG: metalloregulator ArsR/SmtB family transcription factor [Limosilactobacillus gorillae]|jgi:ArsR family transcriptional regulator, zinc-responsive transcriptional repressor|uniref:ArsR/SmtB family transcription factor n=1 Tax=Limosilactobacillus gorillae TaxID=1450649 RepID=UPI000AEF4C42|nr:metalloregulator ArsR/SmtB family transcription factor [Limosilactobacillus gorillae]MDO4856026.1 metalloregulator ArsR/SmtB family transcription factor [Limosilactobacillus gorillae]
MGTNEVNATIDALDQASHLFKLMGHPKRLQLLYLLIQQSMTVSQISQRLKWEQSAVSHQLQILRKYKIVERVKDGRQVVYRLVDPLVMGIIADVINKIRK